MHAFVNSDVFLCANVYWYKLKSEVPFIDFVPSLKKKNSNELITSAWKLGINLNRSSCIKAKVITEMD